MAEDVFSAREAVLKVFFFFFGCVSGLDEQAGEEDSDREGGPGLEALYGGEIPVGFGDSVG